LPPTKYTCCPYHREQDNREGQAEHAATAEERERLGESRDRGAPRDDEVDAPERQHRGERRDERVDAKHAAHCRVQHPHRSGGGKARADGEWNGTAGAKQHPRDDRGKGNHGAHREVDAAGHDHRRHPQRHERFEDEVHDEDLGVGRVDEVRVEGRHQQEQEGDRAGEASLVLRCRCPQPRREDGHATRSRAS
jgi:hypothetical protein